MKSLLFFILFVATAFPALAAETGAPAPAFVVRDIDGHSQSLAQYRGKIVVLEWTNPGCPFVRKHYGSGNMQALQRYAIHQGVVWLRVNSGAPGKEGYMDPVEAHRQIAGSGAMQTAYILDPSGTLGRLYGAKATPHMFVIDQSGRLTYQGAIDDQPTPDPAEIGNAHNYVRAAIDSLLTHRRVEIGSTRAYGCSVKYAY